MCPKTQEEIEYMSRVPYSSAVGSLMYAMVCTRPDIAHAVGVVSRYMNNLGKENLEEVKWIIRYLRGTTTHALCFGGSDTFLQGYVHSYMEGDKDSRRSTTGYVFTIGGTTVSWISKLQKVVALSTTEAEYVASTEASKEMIWLQRFMEELGKKQENNRLYCDSQSAVHLAKNSTFHSKTKHIQLRYQFIRSALEDGKDTHWPESCRHVNKGSNQGETEFFLSFSWSSRMKMKMRNFPGPRRFRVQHIQQQWSC
jgi:hypothetical protein